MKNLIYYYYGFELRNLMQVDNNYYFSNKNNNYYFHRLLNSDFQYELDLINKLKGNFYIHTLILNKDNKAITFDGNYYYILFRINLKRNRIIGIDDILAFKEFTQGYDLKELSMFDWIEMWSKKNDYIEYYINSKDNTSNEIKCMFNYFVGMGENAILYIRHSINEMEGEDNSRDVVLSHKRLEYNYTLYDLYNPMNFIVDHSSRDVAEYLKSLFYNKKITNSKIDEIIEKTNYSKFGYMLLIGRILFPTFFFDLLDKCEDKEISYECIMDVYNYVTEYEKFISYILFSIKKIKKISLPEISWVIKSFN